MMNFRRSRFAATGLLVLAGGAAPYSALGQQHFQNLDAIDALIATATGASIGEPGGATRPVDRRLQLAACPAVIEVDPPAMGAVAVRCPSIGWRIRVAVATPPTAAPMPGAGGALNPADIVVRRGDLVELIVQARGFVATTTGIADQDGAIGQRIRIRVDRRASPCFGQVMADGRISVAGF